MSISAQKMKTARPQAIQSHPGGCSLPRKLSRCPCSCPVIINHKQAAWISTREHAAGQRRCKRSRWQTKADLSSQTTKLEPTPHSGYHFDGSPRRFFEGWYFKVRLGYLAEFGALVACDSECAIDLCR